MEREHPEEKRGEGEEEEEEEEEKEMYLWVGFGSNSAEGTIKDVDERGRVEIVVGAITNEKTTAHTVHAELFLQFAFASLQENFSGVVDVESGEMFGLVEHISFVGFSFGHFLQLGICDEDMGSAVFAVINKQIGVWTLRRRILA